MGRTGRVKAISEPSQNRFALTHPIRSWRLMTHGAPRAAARGREPAVPSKG